MTVSDGRTIVVLLFLPKKSVDLYQFRSSPTPIMERGLTRHRLSSVDRKKEKPTAVSDVAELERRHKQKRMTTAQRPSRIFLPEIFRSNTCK